MIWIVWNSVGETEVDAERFQGEQHAPCVHGAADGLEAAEMWTRSRGIKDPKRLELWVRAGDQGPAHKVFVEGVVSIRWRARMAP